MDENYILGGLFPFNNVFSQLYNKFPNWAMQLHLNATKPPDILFSSSGGNLTIFGDVDVEVVSPTNKSLQQAFALSMVREFEGVKELYGMGGRNSREGLHGNQSDTNPKDKGSPYGIYNIMLFYFPTLTYQLAHSGFQSFNFVLHRLCLRMQR